MDREAEMAEWNDGRLDDLSNRVDGIDRKVDEGFGMVRKEFVRIDQKIDARFDAVTAKFDGLHRVLLQAAVALVVGILGLLGVLIGLVGTQL